MCAARFHQERRFTVSEERPIRSLAMRLVSADGSGFFSSNVKIQLSA